MEKNLRDEIEEFLSGVLLAAPVPGALQDIPRVSQQPIDAALLC